MAPKAKYGVSGDAASFHSIFAVLKHNKSTIEPNWEEVAKETRISYARNASTKFKDLIKRHGYKIEAGKVTLIDESAPTLIATPGKAIASGRKARTLDTKKRKITVEDGEGFENHDEQDEVKVKMNSTLDESGADEKNGENGAEELA